MGSALMFDASLSCTHPLREQVPATLCFFPPLFSLSLSPLPSPLALPCSACSPLLPLSVLLLCCSLSSSLFPSLLLLPLCLPFSLVLLSCAVLCSLVLLFFSLSLSLVSLFVSSLAWSLSVVVLWLLCRHSPLDCCSPRRSLRIPHTCLCYHLVC